MISGMFPLLTIKTNQIKEYYFGSEQSSRTLVKNLCFRTRLIREPKIFE